MRLKGSDANKRFPTNCEPANSTTIMNRYLSGQICLESKNSKAKHALPLSARGALSLDTVRFKHKSGRIGTLPFFRSVAEEATDVSYEPIVSRVYKKMGSCWRPSNTSQLTSHECGKEDLPICCFFSGERLAVECPRIRMG